MTRSKSILGILCLSALGLCMFGASNASAMTLHECLKGIGTQQFKDSKCTEKLSGGEFGTIPIELNKQVELVPTLTPTKGTTETHASLSATIGGIAVEITCTGLNSPNTVAKNVEPEAGKMAVEGTGKSEFTGCALKNPAPPCKVPETITTNELKTSTNEMKTKYQPAVGEEFVKITISGCEGGNKILNGEKAVKGFANATSTEAEPTSQTFETGAGELTFGGQAAVFKATVHFKTKGTETLVALETP